MVRRLLVLMTVLLLVTGFGCAKKPCPAVAPSAAPGAAAPGAPGAAPGAEMAPPTEEGMAAPAPGAEAAPVGAMTRERFETQDVYFDYDRYDLSPEATATLDTKVRFLKGNPGLRVLIEGHCDERGSNEYNLALGERRAHSAKSYLVNAGIDAKRLDTVSFGEERPADPGHDEAAYAKNRRDHFVIVTR